MTREKIIDRLTHYLAEITAVHPFREGNGRAQRAFVGQLANEAGFRIAWERVDQQRNLDASVSSMRGSNALLHAMLTEIVYAGTDGQIDLGGRPRRNAIEVASRVRRWPPCESEE